LPKGFRIERFTLRTVLQRARGTVEPLFDLALYPPGRKDFVVFATGDLCNSHLSRLHPTEPKLWVRGACFELSADKLAAVIVVFGPLKLRSAS
jgi:hypothetical protein